MKYFVIFGLQDKQLQCQSSLVSHSPEVSFLIGTEKKRTDTCSVQLLLYTYSL